MKVVEFLRADGSSPFEEWFFCAGCTGRCENCGATQPPRSGQSHRSEIGWRRGAGGTNRLGTGLSLYLGREGQELIVLLAGGTKRRQQTDIDTAKARWKDYKARKRV